MGNGFNLGSAVLESGLTGDGIGALARQTTRAPTTAHLVSPVDGHEDFARALRQTQ